MNRRQLLSRAGWLGLASGIPLRGWAAQTKPAPLPLPRGSFNFRLGQLELLVVTDGRLVAPTVQPIFAPGVAAAEVTNVLANNFLPTDHVDFALNILLVKTSSRLILIDTGNGTLGGPESGHLLSNLCAAGIRPAAITDVLVTHGHSDHLGGLLTKAGGLAFPQATVHLGRVEHDFWTSPNPDFSHSNPHDPHLVAFQRQTVATVLPAIGHRLRLFEAGETLFGCVRVRLAPGHTPGHVVLTLFSEGQELVHLVDAVHHHALLFAHPEWGTAYDTDFALAVATRTQLLAELADSRQRTFAYHLPWPGLGYVRRQGTGYEWVPEAHATPDAMPGA
jgi:glyoxylase-like metal-dependent hydrolase (beta-lactamase superfamily II)